VADKAINMPCAGNPIAPYLAMGAEQSLSVAEQSVVTT
jgi:hypothetical protein